MKQRRWYLAIIVSIGILSFLGGFYFGVSYSTSFFMELGFSLLEHQKINIDVDEDFLSQGIWQYKNQVSGCLFMKNASIYDNKRS